MISKIYNSASNLIALFAPLLVLEDLNDPVALPLLQSYLAFCMFILACSALSKIVVLVYRPKSASSSEAGAEPVDKSIFLKSSRYKRLLIVLGALCAALMIILSLGVVRQAVTVRLFGMIFVWLAIYSISNNAERAGKPYFIRAALIFAHNFLLVSIGFIILHFPNLPLIALYSTAIAALMVFMHSVRDLVQRSTLPHNLDKNAAFIERTKSQRLLTAMLLCGVPTLLAIMAISGLLPEEYLYMCLAVFFVNPLVRTLLNLQEVSELSADFLTNCTSFCFLLAAMILNLKLWF